jgi:hypothetical protein
MTLRTQSLRTQRLRRAWTPGYVRRRRRDMPDATAAPDPGPPPEAVFDRLTGPYRRRATPAMPGLCEYDEET